MLVLRGERRTSQERWVGNELEQTKKPHRPRSKGLVRRCNIKVVDMEGYNLRRILLGRKIGRLELVNLLVPVHLPLRENSLPSPQYMVP